MDKNAAGREKTDFFWGEIAPCEHIVQVYEKDESFFEALLNFVSEGLAAKEGVIVIATSKHVNILEQRLALRGVDVKAVRKSNQLIVRDADEVLAKFLVNDWPDRELFIKTVSQLLNLARGSGRRVRAFGEMVAVMWERGLSGATVNLEHLWHELVQQEGFPLFCAYPRSGFTQDSSDSIKEICAAHSKVIGDKGMNRPLTPPGTDLSHISVQ